MGARGPTPKRSDQRRRTNSPEATAVSRDSAGSLVWPEADPAWFSAVRRWYEAQARSGQASLLEQSDVETLWLWAAILDDAWQRGELKGSLLSSWSSACRDLLVTEGARRRAQVEIEQNEDVEQDAGPEVTSIHSRLKSG